MLMLIAVARSQMYRAYVQVVLVRQDHVCFKADHVRKLQLQQ